MPSPVAAGYPGKGSVATPGRWKKKLLRASRICPNLKTKLNLEDGWSGEQNHWEGNSLQGNQRFEIWQVQPIGMTRSGPTPPDHAGQEPCHACLACRCTDHGDDGVGTRDCQKRQERSLTNCRLHQHHDLDPSCCHLRQIYPPTGDSQDRFAQPCIPSHQT